MRYQTRSVGGGEGGDPNSQTKNKIKKNANILYYIILYYIILYYILDYIILYYIILPSWPRLCSSFVFLALDGLVGSREALRISSWLPYDLTLKIFCLYTKVHILLGPMGVPGPITRRGLIGLNGVLVK